MAYALSSQRLLTKCRMPGKPPARGVSLKSNQETVLMPSHAIAAQEDASYRPVFVMQSPQLGKHSDVTQAAVGEKSNYFYVKAEDVQQDQKLTQRL